jgi:uncharacterized protein YegL
MRRLPALVAVVFLLAFSGAARAKLDAEQWKQVQTDAARLFVAVGSAEDKAELVKKLVSDEDPRSWKLLADAVIKEAGLWIGLQSQLNEKTLEAAEIQGKPFSQRYPQDQQHLTELEKDIALLDTQLKNERAIFENVITAVAAGPEALRKNLLSRGKSSPDWATRAAAARIAGMHPDEKESNEFLQRTLEQDKDARVRIAALESLRSAETGWEDLIIGRFADPDWGVQLLAAKIAGDRKLRRAVPHLINALGHARPRVVEEIGSILKSLTGQNFDPYPEVWSKWWADHKDEFEAGDVKTDGKPRPPAPDIKYYGIPIKSDRVVFIIDISGSMNLETKKDQPPTPPTPKGPVTPGDEKPKPEPPPPDVVISGKKIEVAKDELRKAIKKLPKATKFNIIAFNSTIQQWSKTMMDAKDEVKEEAIKWVMALSASGGTYTDGALRLAFQIAGLAAVDKAYTEVNVDTIILMSDGEPTDNGWPDTKLMPVQEILDHVKEWNAQKRVVIHTVAMDLKDDGRLFLKNLAEQNGGTFVAK